MLLIPTEVRPSSIHGLGLFTLVPLRKDQEIACFHHDFDRFYPRGVIVSCYEARCVARMNIWDFVQHYGYREIRDELWRLPVDNLRFMNHADDPNTYQGAVSDFAARDIEAGEELTCDYYTFDMDAERKLKHEAPLP